MADDAIGREQTGIDEMNIRPADPAISNFDQHFPGTGPGQGEIDDFKTSPGPDQRSLHKRKIFAWKNYISVIIRGIFLISKKAE
jgi:hypothetical protein